MSSIFPKIENGNCDGLGCSSSFCFCDESTLAKEEFQYQFCEMWDEDSPSCQTWFNAWRFGFNRFNQLLHNTIKDYETVNKELRKEIHELKKQLK